MPVGKSKIKASAPNEPARQVKSHVIFCMGRLLIHTERT
jgi:hypothetical protein